MLGGDDATALDLRPRRCETRERRAAADADAADADAADADTEVEDVETAAAPALLLPVLVAAGLF